MAEGRGGCDDVPMKQTSFASLEYAGKKRKTRRERFLGGMERVVPWAALVALIEPHYPKSGRVGRPPTEQRVHADSGYTGVAKREEIVAAQAEGRMRGDIDWHIAAKRGTIVSMVEGAHKELTVMLERKKAQIRARVEHPFHVIKNLFRHKKVSYRGLAKNQARMFSLFALANLVIVKRPLLRLAGVGAS